MIRYRPNSNCKPYQLSFPQKRRWKEEIKVYGFRGEYWRKPET